MKNFKCCKQTSVMLSKLGYMGEMNYPAVANWLLGMNVYIMPLPKPHFRWEAGIVHLGESIRHDDSLDLTILPDSFMSIQEAVRAGVEYVVEELDYIRRKTNINSN